MKILLVDDELQLLEQLGQILSDQRYIVDTAKDGTEALDRLFDSAFDLIILDIMMPEMDGFTVLSEARQAGISTPVLMLTAKGDVDDKVKGLNLGADDYLEKPFSAAELIARVGAILRRYTKAADPVLQIEDLRLDTVSREVTRAGKLIELTIKEFSILEYLLYNKNRVVSRFNLAEHVWGDDFDPFRMSNVIDVHVKNLRRKIGDSDSHNIIRTMRGLGYIIKAAEECR